MKAVLPQLNQNLMEELLQTQEMNSCDLLVDYIYLDTDEEKICPSIHEYLIEQVQFTGNESIESGTSRQTWT